MITIIKNDIKRITKNIIPQITGVSFLLGKNIFRDDIWIELSVLREESLISLQRDCMKLLKTHSIKTLNLFGSTYRPHITLAKIDKNSLTFLSIKEINHLVDQIAQYQCYFTLELGIADDNWQFVEIIT